MGLCRWAAARANGVRSFDGHRVLSLSSGVVFYAVAGAVAGWVFVVMRRKEDEVSSARAREEVARTLHDGVLQTLALVERRAGDPQLARLAREQERELREFLFGSVRDRDAARDLGAALRDAAARYESRFAGRAQVVVAQDVPRLRADEVEALSGAVGEALTNAGKHGHASRVTVYVEPYEDGPDGKRPDGDGPDGKGPDGDGPDGKGPDGDGRRTRWPDGRWKVFCSVKDDGSGFEVVASAEGVGLSRSIRGRLADAGGRAEVRSQPGTGTEVCLWL
jgi:signal transduction histidine kinase